MPLAGARPCKGPYRIFRRRGAPAERARERRRAGRSASVPIARTTVPKPIRRSRRKEAAMRVRSPVRRVPHGCPSAGSSHVAAWPRLHPRSARWSTSSLPRKCRCASLQSSLRHRARSRHRDSRGFRGARGWHAGRDSGIRSVARPSAANGRANVPNAYASAAHSATRNVAAARA